MEVIPSYDYGTGIGSLDKSPFPQPESGCHLAPINNFFIKRVKV